MREFRDILYIVLTFSRDSYLFKKIEKIIFEKIRMKID